MATSAFDFDAVAGQKWKIVSTGWSCPPGSYDVDVEWENGAEASFVSLSSEIYDWAEEHFSDDVEWFDEPLPACITDHKWERDEEDDCDE